MSKFTAATAHTGILANTKFIPNLYWIGQLCCFLWSIPCILILLTNVSVTIQQVSCPFTKLNQGLLISVSLLRVACSHLPGCDLSSHYGPMSHQTYQLPCWAHRCFVPSFSQLVDTHGNHGIRLLPHILYPCNFFYFIFVLPFHKQLSWLRQFA